MLAALLAALLLRAVWTDILTRQISNRLNIAIALLAPVWWAAIGVPDIALHFAGAAVVLLGVLGLFYFNLMGGGDVKLIAALGLWFGWREMLVLLLVMSLAGAVVSLAALIGHAWRQGKARAEVPYGVAIAFAGLWTIAPWVIGQRYLNQFG